MASFAIGGDPAGERGDTDDTYEDIDEDEDETLGERLWALTEMFPEPLRHATGWTTSSSWNLGKSAFNFGRQALWVVSATAAVMIAPCMIEKISAIMAEAEINQQKQLMFGPSASKLPSASSSFYGPQAGAMGH